MRQPVRRNMVARSLGVLVIIISILGTSGGTVAFAQEISPTWTIQVEIPTTAEEKDGALTSLESALAGIPNNDAVDASSDTALKVNLTGEGSEAFRTALFSGLGNQVNPLGNVTLLTVSANVSAGEEIPFILESNPSTGYRWSVQQLDGGLVDVSSAEDFTPAGGRGLSQQQTLRVQARQSGPAAMQFVYRRPWEPSAPVTARWSFNAGALSSSGLDLSNPVRPSLALQEEDAFIKAADAVFTLDGANSLPASFDWRAQNKVSPVRDQGNCGSCWAFGAVGAAESALLIGNASGSTDLAEQYLLNCDTTNYGCSGGLGYNALDYFKWYGKYNVSQTSSGAVLETTLPYKQANGTCGGNYTKPHHIASRTYITNMLVPEVNELKNAIYNFGPVTAGVCVGSAFQSYTGGVFATNETCGGSTNHEINLVGWDDSTQSWILRNSWGSSWGENGYMRIRYGISGVGQDATLVLYSSSQPAAAADSASSAAALPAGDSGRLISYVGGASISSNDPIPTCGSGNRNKSVWYKHTAAASGTWTLNTGGSDYDTILSVWTGTPGSFTSKGCSDDESYGNTSSLSLAVTAGTTYYVMVSAYSTPAFGYGTLVLNSSAPAGSTPSAPLMNSISPAAATAGDSEFNLTVAGSNFVNNSVVQWNGSALATAYISSTQLTAVVPAANVASAGTASVTVYTAGAGTSGAATFTISDAVNATPVITSLSPASITAGASELILTVNGSNFSNNATVRWNDSDLVTTFIGNTRLTALVSADKIAAPGTASVTVYDPAQGEGLSNASSFTITQSSIPAPTLTGLSPASVYAGSPAITMRLSGTNFTNTSVVLWNNVQVGAVYLSSTRLLLTVPASSLTMAGTVAVAVSNAASGSGVSNSKAFYINNPRPILSSINPTRLPVGYSSDVEITVTGRKFVPGAVARWNGIDLATTYVSDSQLKAVIPASIIPQSLPGGASRITVRITVYHPAPGGGLSSSLSLIINNSPRPKISRLSQSSFLRARGETSFTVYGSNFSLNSVVKWGGSPLNTTYINSSTLQAVVPTSFLTSSKKVLVVVYTPAPGGGTSPGKYVKVK